MPRPADECPYQRPLPEGFDACPAFHPVRFVPLNARHEPLRPVLICRHMVLGQRQDLPSTAFYCRCAVGDATARRQVAEATDEERRRLLRELADGVMAVVLAHWEELGRVKGRESAAAGEEARLDARRAVREIAAAVGADMHAAIEGPLRDHVSRLGVMPADLEAVVDAGVEDFIAHGFTSWHPPEHLLWRLPPDVAAFLRPPHT